MVGDEFAAAEPQERNINVIGAYLGYADTSMVADLDVPKNNPVDVARQIVDGVEAGAADVIADEFGGSAVGGLIEGVFVAARKSGHETLPIPLPSSVTGADLSWPEVVVVPAGPTAPTAQHRAGRTVFAELAIAESMTSEVRRRRSRG